MERRKPLRRKTPLSQRAPLSPGENGLKRTGSLRNQRRDLERLRARAEEPGYAAWHAPTRGKCAVCRRPGPLVRHHAVQEQTIRRAGGNPWDLRWSILLSRYCDCHERHHSRGVTDRRLDYRFVSMDAIRLAYRTLGPGPAASYFRRRYRNAPEIDPREVPDGHHSEARS